jgi:hypothetical protein
MTNETIMLPVAWESHFGFKIMDPDGWRSEVRGDPILKPQSWNVRMNELEFLRRANVSTIYGLDKFPTKRYIELTHGL